MIEIAKAIKSRWTAKSLGTSITGGIHHSRPAENAVMPYCVFTEVSAGTATETVCGRADRVEVQFDVFDDDGNAETTADLAQLVLNAMVHGQSAGSNPIAPTGLSLTDVRISRNIVTTAEGTEQVYRSMFSLVLMVSQSSDRTPAS